MASNSRTTKRKVNEDDYNLFSDSEEEEVTLKVPPPAPKKTFPAAANGNRTKSDKAAERKLLNQRKRELNNNNIEKGAPTMAVNNENDENEPEEPVEFSSLLSQIGSGLEQRIRAKRAKIENIFKGMKMTPDYMYELMLSKNDDRKKLEETVKLEMSKIREKVQQLSSLHSVNEEKVQKMVTSIQRSQEQLKTGLNEIVNFSNAMIDNFTSTLANLEKEEKESSKSQLEAARRELLNIQRKIVKDCQTEETDILKNSFKM